MSDSNTNRKIAYTLKVRGGAERDSKGRKAGKGALVQENMSATLGTSQDQYLFAPKFINSSGGGIAGTLDANYYKGCGEREGIEREFVAVRKDDKEHTDENE
jgi:hypothetical protein